MIKFIQSLFCRKACISQRPITKEEYQKIILTDIKNAYPKYVNRQRQYQENRLRHPEFIFENKKGDREFVKLKRLPDLIEQYPRVTIEIYEHYYKIKEYKEY